MFYIAASHNDPISDSSLRRADVTFRLNASLPQRQHKKRSDFTLTGGFVWETKPHTWILKT